MINLYIVLLIIIIHWIADFVCQSDKDAQGKSKNWNNLLSHTIQYSAVFAIFSIVYGIYSDNKYLILFPIITLVCHTAIDYYTSRVNSQLWKDEKVHNFFVSIEFDQVLHYIQLFVTFYLLTK